MKYHQAYDGDTIRPKMKGYKAACCDCGLVHTYNFAMEISVKRGKKPTKQFLRLMDYYLGEPQVVYQVWRNNRATAAVRRNKKHKGLKLGKGK